MRSFRLWRAVVAIVPAGAGSIVTASCAGSDSPTATPSASIGVNVVQASVEVVQGQSGLLDVRVTRNGYDGPIALTLEGRPAGVTHSFAPATIPGTSSTGFLNIFAAREAAPGTTEIVVRASGNGVADQTDTVRLTIVEAAEYSLELEPTTISAAPGGSATATIRIVRADYTGEVSLHVFGAPAGVTASISPGTVAGETATLTVNVAISVAPGTYSLTILGQAPALDDRTHTLQLVVTSSSGGVNWSFCSSAAPIWLAYQNDAGPWTALPVSAGSAASIPIDARGGVAFVWRGSGLLESIHLAMFFGTRDQLAFVGSDWCASFGGGKQYPGDVVSLGPSDHAFVVVGSSGAVVMPTQPTFTLTNVPDGPRDLLSSRQTTIGSGATAASVADRFLFYRDLDLPDGTPLILDFASDQAFDPVQRTVTIGNLGSEEAGVSLGYVTSNRTSGLLFSAAELSSDVVRGFPGVHGLHQEPGDLHMLIVNTGPTQTSNPDQTSDRGALEFFRDATDRTVSLGASLAEPTVAALTANPYVRLEARLPRQSDYDDEIRLLAIQGTRTLSINVTAGYLAAGFTTWEATVPDLTSAGFEAAWGIHPGLPTIWALSAFGYGVGGAAPLLAPVDGLTVLTATRSGAIVP